MKPYRGVLSSILLSFGILVTLNYYLVPISYLSPAFFAKVKPTLLPEGYYNQRACSSLKSYLKNKRVAIVGPAASFEDSKYGSEIDAHDIVVRVNSAVWEDEDFKSHYGSRTDILISSFYGPNLTVLNRFSETWKDARFVIAMLNFSGDPFDIWPKSGGSLNHLFDLMIKRHITFCSLTDIFFLEFERATGLRANTGIAAIAFLLKTNIKALDIYGFDFYDSLYNRWQTKAFFEVYPERSLKEMHLKMTKAANAHDQFRHVEYFRNQIQNDKRVNFLKPRKEK